MSLDTYTNLKAEIADHLDRDGDDLTSQIDSFIDIAEARHRREVRIREMIARAQATVDERYLALPDDFLDMLSLRLLTDPVTVVEGINFHEMARRRKEETGKPTLYTVHNEIEFDKSPDDSYTAEMLYYKKLTALSDANSSNAILSRAPDAYLYGALLAAEPFLMNDERITVWAQFYAAARDTLNMMDRRRAGPLVSRVAGATP